MKVHGKAKAAYHMPRAVTLHGVVLCAAVQCSAAQAEVKRLNQLLAALEAASAGQGGGASGSLTGLGTTWHR